MRTRDGIAKIRWKRMMDDANRLATCLEIAQDGDPVSEWFAQQEKIRIDDNHTAIATPDGRFVCWKNGNPGEIHFRDYSSIEGFLNSEKSRKEDIKLEKETEDAAREYYNRPGKSGLFDD